MNANGIMNMVMRMVMRKLVGKGVNAGIDRAFGKGKSHDEMTPEERRRAKGAKQQTRQAGKAMRAARRIGRF
ncbi:hypothetical protein SAMN05421853_10943 [Roseivivax halotolerans]|jgi:hypothetical protein|uniref:Uncharacterized protein n=1 Tax=Roseivivax halotolerans TaxID=93684 RepID=A0A1I5ZDE8_9RHOB|nr:MULTISPECIES: hypothetical protein [Roseivivax]QFT63199.1 hypothetical protein FIU91_09710 [Roseivivax sp. THAF30]SFQ54480.1 hypothetical protein SAMN05421853_10943 [Roseivivax halotolerans]